MKKKIINPFTTIFSDDYKCIGCSPNNDIGLSLEFFEDTDFVYCEWVPTKNFEGYKEVVHGGVLAILVDEISAWIVYTKCKTAGVTESLNISYHHPARINNRPLLVRGKLKSINENKALIHSEILNADGKVLCEADITYFLYPEKIAKTRLHYPGNDSFYE